jgi:glycerol kinase
VAEMMNVEGARPNSNQFTKFEADVWNLDVIEAVSTTTTSVGASETWIQTQDIRHQGLIQILYNNVNAGRKCTN